MSTAVSALGKWGFGAYQFEFADGRLELSATSETPAHYLIPGFVDLHIHGGFGIDFMSASPSDLISLATKLAKKGYEGFLPTTITASAPAILKAIGQLPEHPMILGFHLEGPFLSPSYPGAQPPNAIVDPPLGPSEWDAILDHPRLKVVTLAPERPAALDLILRLSRRGVRVGMGHTNATFDESKAGFEAGATHTTHTYNAMRSLHHREAGPVGFAFTEVALACELIYDRVHVSKPAAEILVRQKAADKLIAVSDGTQAVGLPPGSKLAMWGRDCIVGDQDVRLVDGALAGSTITLHDAFCNLADDFGAETAIRATSLNPRHLLGLNLPPRVYLLLNSNFEILERFEVESLTEA